MGKPSPCVAGKPKEGCKKHAVKHGLPGKVVETCPTSKKLNENLVEACLNKDKSSDHVTSPVPPSAPQVPHTSTHHARPEPTKCSSGHSGAAIQSLDVLHS